MLGRIVGFCFLLTLFSVVHKSDAIYEANILEMIEDIRRHMCYAEEDSFLPQLEPFALEDEIPFDIDSEDLGKLSGYVRNLRVEGLSSLLVNSLNFALTFRFGFVFVVPRLVVTADYALKGNLAGFFNLDGEGKLSLEFGGLLLGADGQLRYTTGEGMKLENLKLQLGLDMLKANIENLTRDEELNEFFDDAISELLPKFVNEYIEEDTLDGLIKQVEALVSDALKDITAADILALVNGSGEPLLPPLDEEKACPARPKEEDLNDEQTIPEILQVLRSGMHKV